MNALRIFPLIILLLVGGLSVIGVGYVSLIRSDHKSDRDNSYTTSRMVIAALLVLAILSFILLIVTTVR